MANQRGVPTHHIPFAYASKHPLPRAIAHPACKLPWLESTAGSLPMAGVCCWSLVLFQSTYSSPNIRPFREQVRDHLLLLPVFALFHLFYEFRTNEFGAPCDEP